MLVIAAPLLRIMFVADLGMLLVNATATARGGGAGVRAGAAEVVSSS